MEHKLQSLLGVIVAQIFELSSSISSTGGRVLESRCVQDQDRVLGVGCGVPGPGSAGFGRNGSARIEGTKLKELIKQNKFFDIVKM